MVSDVSPVIQANQYKRDKQSLEKKIGKVENKIPDVSGLVTTTVLNTKIGINLRTQYQILVV